MVCVNVSVSEKRRCFVSIYRFLIMEKFYSFERCFTLFDLPLYSFPSVGVNRSGPFIPTDSGMPRTVVPRKSLQLKTVHGCVPCMVVCQSGQPIPNSTCCSRFIESVRMMACVVCASCWEASHCIAFVTASTSMVRLETKPG